MAEHAAFLRVKTVPGKNAARVCARHNLREIAAELGADSHIASDRTCQNIVLHGGTTSADVVDAELKILQDAEFTRPMRKNQVRLIEVIFSLTPGSTIDFVTYFDECWRWGVAFYGVQCISAVVHFDESAHHCHALYVPIVNGKMCGSALVGGLEKLRQARMDFAERVAARFGLSLAAPRKRLPLAERRKMVAAIIKALRNTPALLNEPSIKDALNDVLIASPQGVYDAIKKPIGNCAAKQKQPEQGHSAPVLLPENTQTLSLCRVSISDTVSAATSEPFSRTHDDDYLPSDWDSDTGEFYAQAPRDRKTILY